MKTTIELSDNLFRKAKAAAAHEGLTLKKLFTQALEIRLRKTRTLHRIAGPEWMQAYGALRHLQRDRKRVERAIESEFERIEPEDRG